MPRPPLPTSESTTPNDTPSSVDPPRGRRPDRRRPRDSLERPMLAEKRKGRVKLPPEEPSIPQRKGGTGVYWLYLLPGFVLLLVIVIVPLVWNVYLPFTKWKGVREPEFIGLDNWVKLFGDSDFWTSFSNSVWMIIAMVVAPTIVGLIVAA